MVRSLLWALDLVVVHSGLSNASKFLDCDITLSGVAFPKPGAFPFASLNQLSAVKDACVRLSLRTRVRDESQCAHGVGLIIGSNADARLFTVRHNLINKHDVSFDNDRYVESVRTVNIVGSSRDPAVTMPLVTKPTFRVDLSLLAKRECKAVNYLFMVTPEGMIAPISEFDFDDDGDLHAVVSLKPGDSGTPIVAVMNDGVLRLAGTVSRGTISEGTPNIVSCVAGDHRVLQGSPGVEEPYMELLNVKTETDWRVLSEIDSMLESNRAKWRGSFGDILENWNENEKKWDWDGLEDETRRQRQRRVKNWKKNAAMRKRAFMSLVEVSRLTDDQKELAEAAFDNHEVRRFNFQRGIRQPGYGLGFVPGQG